MQKFTATFGVPFSDNMPRMVHARFWGIYDRGIDELKARGIITALQRKDDHFAPRSWDDFHDELVEQSSVEFKEG